MFYLYIVQIIILYYPKAPSQQVDMCLIYWQVNIILIASSLRYEIKYLHLNVQLYIEYLKSNQNIFIAGVGGGSSMVADDMTGMMNYSSLMTHEPDMTPAYHDFSCLMWYPLSFLR